MTREKYITPSEIANFTFCQRAWWLQKQGAPTTLERERADGVEFHQRHGEAVRSADRASKLAIWFAAAAIVLLVLALLVLAG